MFGLSPIELLITASILVIIAGGVVWFVVGGTRKD
jgi:hypothetical protein